MMRSVSLKLAALFCVLAPQALADIPEIMACAGKADGKERLACYDAAVAKLKTEEAEAQARRFSLFGFNLPFGDSSPGEEEHAAAPADLGPREVNEIDAKLGSATKDFAGHLILTLDNGQVWRVEDFRQVSLAKRKDTTIAIVRNGFGGYYLGVNGDDNKLTVTRLK